eukprot:gnl/MRDRNA2_/MRDRNA2_55998_c0_seq2.p2 gnl/MRDRNA2_/MRDRNA2_55998_c0~~gnl/MRDRNA2_/MRDRNA2_55998_c0_seq2.p2  ORF type:complete len:154 (+),score=24.35 gnl/MRDRNA2_/MRDRNA2_55998_c0_seq2:718-1179(+)
MPDAVAERLFDLPVWAFHAKNDIVTSHYKTEKLVHNLREMGASADEAKLTLYDEAPATRCNPDSVGHGSTYLAYNDSSLFDWLLKHHGDANLRVQDQSSSSAKQAHESVGVCTEQIAQTKLNSTSDALGVQCFPESICCLVLFFSLLPLALCI